MAHITEDRVLESGTANTTVSFTLAGAVTGFRTFSSQMVVADTCWYASWAVDVNGSPTGAWENGLGTLSTTTTLTRTTVLESSNANAAVSTFTGTLYVALTLTASRVVQLDNNLVVSLPRVTSEPTAVPAAGTGYLYWRDVAGQTVLKVKRDSGEDSPLQDSIVFNRVIKTVPGGTTLVTMGGAAPTTTGSSITAVVSTTGSARSSTPKNTIASAATAGAICPVYASTVATGGQMWGVHRGNQAGEGGFRFVIRFGLNATLQAGNIGFFGLADTVGVAPTATASTTTATTPGKVGLAFVANTGNFQLVNNTSATAPTVLDLGANFALDTTSLFELVLFCRPFSTTAGNIGYRLRKYTAASGDHAFETTGTLSTNIPAATTLLYPLAYMSNNATAASVAWTFHSLSIESDW